METLLGVIVGAAITAFVSLRVAKQNQQTTIINTSEQIESATRLQRQELESARTLHQEQLESVYKLHQEQLESAYKLHQEQLAASLTQLKHQLDVQIQMNAAQLKAQTELPERLRWQNDFRTTLAHIDSEVLDILMLGGGEDEPLTEKQKAVYKSVTFHWARLQLMLPPTVDNPDDAQQLEPTIESLVEALLKDVKGSKWAAATQTRKKLITASKQLLHKHWADIQNMTEEAKNLPTIP